MTSGNSYVVPENGVITSWSTNAAAGSGQFLRMKIFRPVSGLTYMAVGHDAEPLTPNTVNTFAVNISVKAGDVLGETQLPASTSNACLFFVSGQPWLQDSEDLGDGMAAAFSTRSEGYRVNATAVLVPQPASSGPTGERAVALKKCKKKHSKRARRKCRKKANLLPV